MSESHRPQPQPQPQPPGLPVIAPERLAALPGDPLRVGVLLSGGGRTLANLLARTGGGGGGLPIRIVGAIHSRQAGRHTAAAAAACQAHGVPLTTLRPADFPDREAFATAQTAQLLAWRAEWVCMAGYLVHWPIPPAYRWRVLNIHPSLLPAYGGRGYYGERVHAAVLAAGERESGCTVHFADDEYDHGAILLQRRVPVEPQDTVATLAARVFAAECKAYPEALARIAAGRVRIVPAENRAITLPPA